MLREYGFFTSVCQAPYFAHQTLCDRRIFCCFMYFTLRP